jgi:preprotein translocase subunit SecA
VPFSAQPKGRQARRGGAARKSGSAAGGRRRAAAPVQALFGGLGALLRNDPAERTRKQYQPRVDQINALESSMEKLSDEQLRQLTQALRKRAQGGESLDSLLVEAFAVRPGCRPLLYAACTV